MKTKKLKDLKKGDMVYLSDFTDTTPIIVTSAKRTGMLMEISLKWDTSEYTCYGHAFSTTFVGYKKSRYVTDTVFTTDYQSAFEEMRLQNNMKRRAVIGELLGNLIKAVKGL